MSEARRVLVVEDDQGVAKMLGLALRSGGFDVARAATGAQALHMLETQPADAVVLDLGLPDGLGGAVLDRLRHPDGPPGGAPVWVVISAMDVNDATRRYGSLEGHFLAKPFDPWHLVRTLESLMSGTGDLSPDGAERPARDGGRGAVDD